MCECVYICESQGVCVSVWLYACVCVCVCGNDGPQSGVRFSSSGSVFLSMQLSLCMYVCM